MTGTYTPPSGAVVKTARAYLDSAGVPDRVNLMQYDTGTPVLEVQLYEGVTSYKVPANADVSVRVGKPDGKHVYNPVLGVNTPRTSVYIAVTHQMTAAAGEAVASVEIRLGNGVLGVGYVTLNVRENPVPEDAIISGDEYKTLEEIVNQVKTDSANAKKSAAAAKADADRAQTAAEQLADKAQKTYVDQTFAPAIRETLVGATVATDMVSPVVHDLVCKVYSENLVPFPFRDHPASVNGVTFSYENGAITANGTASGKIRIGLIPLDFRADAGTYTVSGCPKIDGCLLQAKYDGEYGKYDTGDGATFVAKQEVTSLVLQISEGTTVNDAVFKPKLQMGAKATIYTPYVSDLTKAKVNVCGKNLVPFPFREHPDSMNGVTFTYKNGTVTANGTASDKIRIGLLPLDFRAGAGSYAISGCPKIDGCLLQPKYDGEYGSKYDTGDGVTFVANQEVTSLVLQISAGTAVNNAVFKPMLCVGTTPAPFEPYQSKIYTPASDGTINGAKSIAPHMSVMTYAQNAVVRTTYSMDTKKYIDKKLTTLSNAILSMGGNI